MPTQRTLLMMIAGLVVMVSFLIGYISGQTSTPQSAVQSLNNSVRVSKEDIVSSKNDDPVSKKTGSSYTKFYNDRNEEIIPPKPFASRDDEVGAGLTSSDAEVSKKPKLAFRPVPKQAEMYSWRQKNARARADRDEPDYTAATQVEQGDGYIVQPRRKAQPRLPLQALPLQGSQQDYYRPYVPQPNYGAVVPQVPYDYGFNPYGYSVPNYNYQYAR